MRILLYTRIFRLAGSGAEDYAVRLCQGLASRGHEVHVVADEISDAPSIHTYEGTVNIRQLREQINPDITIDWSFITDADIHRMGSGVHGEFMKYSLDAYSGLSRLYKKIRYRSNRHREIINRQEKLLQQPDAWFLPNSRFCAEQAIAGGACSEQVKTLYNGVDTSHFSPPGNTASVNNMRQAWGVKSNDIVFLFVAHNLRLKNYPLLAQLFHRNEHSHPELKLLIAGKHKPRHMPANCYYIGAPSSMADVYRASDILLHPTFYDSCANVVLEAMSSGLPAVVSDRCGANELIDDQQNGFVLPVTGIRKSVAQNWQSLIIQLAGNQQQREFIGKNARKNMLKHDFVNYINSFESILERKLAG